MRRHWIVDIDGATISTRLSSVVLSIWVLSFVDLAPLGLEDVRGSFRLIVIVTLLFRSVLSLIDAGYCLLVRVARVAVRTPVLTTRSRRQPSGNHSKE